MNTLKLSTTRKGRIALHLVCLMRDHKTAWHMAGIIREIKGI
jgi:hypothetical protein